MSSFFPCALAFLLAVNAAYGLKCYTCSSIEDPSCVSTPTKLVECPSAVNDYQCFKAYVQIKSGIEIVGRGCVLEGPDTCDTLNMLASFGADALKNVECNLCKYDNCNSARSIKGATFIGLVLAAAIFVF